MNKLVNGAPSLIGVIAGVWLYSASDICTWAVVLGVFLVALVSMEIGKYVTVKHPRVGMLLIEVWVLSSVCLVAFSTAFIVWLTINSPSWFNVPPEHVDVVTGAFIGAITTYFASAWIDDIANASGIFWPSTQLKNAFKKFQLTGDTEELEAAQLQRVRNGGPEGWGIKSRWQRASILSKYIQRCVG